MTKEEWIQELDTLEAYFKTVQLPAGPIKLGGYMTIHNPATFIDTNIQVARQNAGNSWFEGAIMRLREMKAYLDVAY